MVPWWDRIEGRLNYELDALRQAGVEVTIDDDARTREKLIKLRLTLPEGRWLTRTLIAVFPDTYPYTRPEVSAPDLSLDHHQNPLHKNLCLLGRASANWRTTDTLASILETQLPLLAASVTDAVRPDEDVEEQQGEPVTTYLAYARGSVVFVDSGWKLPPDIRHGVFHVRLLDDRGVCAVVQSVGAANGVELAKGPFVIDDGQVVRGAWVRLDAPVVSNDPGAWMHAFETVHPLAKLELKKRPRFIGFVFPEELGYRTRGDGWVFVALEHQPGRFAGRLVRAARAGADDLAARFPQFRDLQRRRIAVFGLGCVGAPSLLEFARAGVGELRCADPDLVDVGTTVRWPFGVDAAGWPKAMVLKEFLRREYPWVNVRSFEHRVGSVLQESRDAQVLSEMFSEVDLVYDATAELGIQHLLSDLARERGIPYICISGTPGGNSGIVARMRHDGPSGCWTCFQHAMTDGRIELPPLIAGGEIQPQGCANVTFVGANYDFMEVALQGVRLAVATLLGRENRREDYRWDVAVLRNRDEDGQRIEPRWTVYPLERDPKCPACAYRQATAS